MDSFYTFFDEEKTGIDYGYAYGFDNVAKINGKKIKIKL